MATPGRRRAPGSHHGRVADDIHCPVCGDQDEAAVGHPPERPRRAHHRSCPVRFPDGSTPARLPRVPWTDPAAVAAAALPPPVPRPRMAKAEKVALIRAWREQGLTFPAIAARLGYSTPYVWHLANGKR
jgi:hypothetical protein